MYTSLHVLGLERILNQMTATIHKFYFLLSCFTNCLLTISIKMYVGGTLSL